MTANFGLLRLRNLMVELDWNDSVIIKTMQA